MASLGVIDALMRSIVAAEAAVAGAQSATLGYEADVLYMHTVLCAI